MTLPSTTPLALLVAAALLVLTPRLCHTLPNGLGRTPQMGYNTWYDLGCNLQSQELLMQTVDLMVSLGLRDLGYRYFNLDDCWSVGRQPNGTLIADPKIFPSGTLKELADYVHSKDMLFGTYGDRGNFTCGQRPGALGHEVTDANTYASWGVDYFKEDSCYASQDHATAFAEYATMRDALNATGRKIFFSLCGWESWYAPVGQTLGNSWRIGPDDTNWQGVLTNIDINSELSQYSGPGGWNDPCLLLAETADGTLRMTPTQTRTQFNFWAITASPMLISANIRNMSVYNLRTYTNADVIAVNQDPLGKQGFRVVGGNFTTGNNPISVASCNAADPNQKWTFNTPAANYVHNAASNQCFNVDNCGQDIIAYDCVTSGGTCAGKTNYANMQFVINANGTMSSPVHPGECVAIAADNTLWLSSCNSGSPKWSFSSSTGLIQTANGMCVTMAPLPGSRTNVWARQLSGESTWALLFVNIGPTTEDITCNSTCFAKLGFTNTNQALVLRDLWVNTTSTIYPTGLTVPTVPPNGGSSMFKIWAQ